MKSTIRRKLKVAIIVVLSILVLLMMPVLFVVGTIVVSTLFIEPTIIQSVSSPNGEYVAYVYEKNGGATTGFIYHISILRSDRKLRYTNGNVYIDSLPPNNIEWLSDDVLFVDDYRSGSIAKQKTRINGLTIRYRSLE